MKHKQKYNGSARPKPNGKPQTQASNVQVGNANGLVVVQFDSLVNSFALPPAQAREFALMMIAHAAEIDATAKLSQNTAIASLQSEIAAIKEKLKT